MGKSKKMNRNESTGFLRKGTNSAPVNIKKEKKKRLEKKANVLEKSLEDSESSSHDQAKERTKTFRCEKLHSLSAKLTT